MPGASPNYEGTLTYGANDQGDVVGEYADSAGEIHGFIRYGNNGWIETIDVPAAMGSETRAFGNHFRGTIVGRYTAADDTRHGFILDHGMFTTLDVPGAANTQLYSINDPGDVAGLSYNERRPSASSSPSGKATSQPRRRWAIGGGEGWSSSQAARVQAWPNGTMQTTGAAIRAPRRA